MYDKIKSGLVPKLLDMLCNVPYVVLLTPVLQTVGNIVTGTDEQTEVKMMKN